MKIEERTKELIEEINGLSQASLSVASQGIQLPDSIYQDLDERVLEYRDSMSDESLERSLNFIRETRDDQERAQDEGAKCGTIAGGVIMYIGQVLCAAILEDSSFFDYVQFVALPFIGAGVGYMIPRTTNPSVLDNLENYIENPEIEFRSRGV